MNGLVAVNLLKEEVASERCPTNRYRAWRKGMNTSVAVTLDCFLVMDLMPP